MEKQSIPSFLKQYFWGDDFSQININDNQKYIIQTLLENGDDKALKWLFSVINKQTILTFLSTVKLSKKSGNFWQIYLS
ncbi:MAG TPA: hypothetical protein VMR41_00180 [Patescibacteria group bacterium]|nr:hypothetical protein [Patescibacteria group bacterium]